MGESLTQRRRVRDEGLRVVNLGKMGRISGPVIYPRDLTVPPEEAPANYVPAAAVIRRGQALFGITGRKGSVGGYVSLDVKYRGSTRELHLKLFFLSMGEGSGIPGVAVKCVDIWKNTSGEGGFLDQY